MYPTEDITDLWIAINRAQRGIYRAIDGALKQEGLPPLRWYDVLWELEKSDRGLRPYELEGRLIFEQSNLSRLLQRIIGDDLAEEAAFDGDRRGKVIRITTAGLEIRKQMWKIYGPQIQEHLGKIIAFPNIASSTAALNSLIKSSEY